MSEHDKRIRDIARWVAPPEGSPARARLDAWVRGQKKIDPLFDKKVRKTYKKARAIAWSQLETGAGMQMDQLVRHFSNEFNWRNLQQGLLSMPGSFNVMEAFFQYEPENSVFRIFDERDHIVSFLDFLDFITSGDGTDDMKVACEAIEDDIIYSYNLSNSPEDFTFSAEDGAEFAAGGFSLVRHGPEISLLILAGEKTDTKVKTEELRKKVPTIMPVPGREWLNEVLESGEHRAVEFLGNSAFWQVLLLTRLNVETMTHDVRYLLRDAGSSFLHLTDDVSLYLNERREYVLPELEKIAKQQAHEIKKYAAVFELAKTCILLPSYFETYTDDVVEERHPTEFAESKHDLRRVQRNQLLTRKEKILFRRVSVLPSKVKRQPDLVTLNAPDFQVDVSGFWKQLKPGELGANKHGRPIHGRTWVKQTLSWIETEDPEILRVKTSDVVEPKQGSKAGFIYVMRSAAHDKDIFKIGLTTRNADTRSDELSSTTGSPDKFLVVQEWKVSDCALAEKRIHERLDHRRLGPKREFFRAPYKEIFRVIDEVITALDDR